MSQQPKHPVQVELWRSFTTKDGKGGNAAGVVLDAKDLDIDRMQEIATVMGVSETAFIRGIGQDARKACIEIFFFTPTTQVGLCGHATVASGAALLERGSLEPGDYMQNTTLGSVDVRTRNSGHASFIAYHQPVPKQRMNLRNDEVASALGIESKKLLKSFHPTSLDTDALVGVRSNDDLQEIVMDHERLTRFLLRHTLEGMHVFALCDKEEGVVADCRNFAPTVGIPEESATGSATGLLAAELIKQQIIRELQGRMLFRQGKSLGLDSEIWVSAEGSVSDPDVYVGGLAVKDEEREVIV